MDKVISKKFLDEQLNEAGKNYARYLKKYCTKKELIGFLVQFHEDYFPDELCNTHLVSKV